MLAQRLVPDILYRLARVMRDDIQECYESYTMMPDRRALLVRFVGDEYVGLLVDSGLHDIIRVEISGVTTIMDATVEALEMLEIEANITTVYFKESIVERDCPVGVDEGLLESVRTTSTESLEVLAEDETLGTEIRRAIKQVLRERRG